MGIWSRILGNGKATLNSPIRKLKGFFRPATDEYFDDPDVVAIYYRALKRKQEFAVLTEYTRYLRDRQDILSGGLSPSELIYNNDLDSDSRDFIKGDLASWLEVQQKKKELKEHFQAYVIFNAFSISINLMLGPLSWSLYPLIAWSSSLLVLTINTYQGREKESLEYFKKWTKIREKLDTLISSQSSSRDDLDDNKQIQTIQNEEMINSQEISDICPENEALQTGFSSNCEERKQKGLLLEIGTKLQELEDQFSQNKVIESFDKQIILTQSSQSSDKFEITINPELIDLLDTSTLITIQTLNELIDHPVIKILLKIAENTMETEKEETK